MFATRIYTIFLVLLIGPKFVKLSDAKRNYKVEVEAFKIFRDPSSPVRINWLRVSKYNSTINVVNGNITYKEDLPADTMVRMTAYQLLNSNKYSMIPVGPKPYLVCDIIEKDKEYWPAFVAKGNFPTKCPIRKGNYWLENFVLDVEEMPKELPGERWRVDFEGTTKGRIVAKFQAFIYLNRNM